MNISQLRNSVVFRAESVKKLSVLSCQISVFRKDTKVQKVKSDKVILSLPMGSCRGVREGNVTNLRILPGMGKIKLTAGSPEWAPVESETCHTMQPASGLRYWERDP